MSIFEYVFFRKDNSYAAMITKRVERMMSFLLLLVNACSIAYALSDAPIFHNEEEQATRSVCGVHSETNDMLLTMAAIVEAAMLMGVLLPAAYFWVQLHCIDGEC